MVAEEEEEEEEERQRLAREAAARREAEEEEAAQVQAEVMAAAAEPAPRKAVGPRAPDDDGDEAQGAETAEVTSKKPPQRAEAGPISMLPPGYAIAGGQSCVVLLPDPKPNLLPGLIR